MYYDYDFQEMIDQLEELNGTASNIYSREGEILTELQTMHTDVNTRLDTLQTTMQNGITLIAALIVISAAVKVLMK